ncbi:hypothetical protein QN277_015669 [Acacia crassicarpa]|uniref:WRKY domain-containing protein n=1 Tax=Acacia crassicarpa TaxID=499986 RepID=A0AAE1JWC6_9FABA|nr:hypothetical protein QN277_015669 [Acacia crassicarpa]
MDDDVTRLIQRACELARNLESNLHHISESTESAVRWIDEIVMILNAVKGKLLPAPVVSQPREDEANKQEITQQQHQLHQVMASSLLPQWLSGGHHSQLAPMSQLQAPTRRTTSAPHLMGASRDVDPSAEADVEASPSPRRRKSIRKDEGEKRTIMVQAAQFGNTDVPPEDGYTWRKYGQKEILGSNFPRSYFRCTHQKLYQCPAKKQVQRLDNNPNIFAVTYRGSHTCHMSSTAPSSSVPPQLMIPQAQSHATSSQLSPPSSSIHCWLSPVHLGLLTGGSSGGVNPAGAESGGGSAGPSTSRFGGADYPVADMADAMFNSGSSSGNSMESLFAFADDKGEAGDNKKS